MTEGKMLEEAKKNRQDYSFKGLELRIIESFLDFLVLSEIKSKMGLTGDEIARIINIKFDQNISLGKIYSILNSMETDNLLTAETSNNKTRYKITKEGQNVISSIQDSEIKLEMLLIKIF